MTRPGAAGAPAREFWRRFATLRGYRDGALGLLLPLALAYFEWQAVRRARALAAGRGAANRRREAGATGWRAER